MSRPVKSDAAPHTTRREQAQETRVRIMRAAVDVFGRQGYSGARMTDVARAAGVAVQTVYFAFHTKPELVQACYEYAVLGPDRVVPAERPWFQEALRARSAKAAIGHFARGNGEIVERAAVVDDIARSALHEPEIAEVRARSESLRRDGYRAILAHLEERFGLRPGVDLERAVDLTLVLAGGQVYLQLRSYGWTHEEYVAWLAATLEQQLIRGRH